MLRDTIPLLVLLASLFLAARALGTPSGTAAAVSTLQPEAAGPRAAKLGALLDEAGEQHGFDPLLLAAMAFRESSFSPAVERGEWRGELGEGGIMQTHGVSLRFMPEGCGSLFDSAWCQIQTGARFLSVVRRACPGSTWRWVAAYGMSRCPSEAEARADPATRRARAYYVRVGGEQWSE